VCCPADGTRPWAIGQHATSCTLFPRSRLLTDSFLCFPIPQRLPGQRLSTRRIAHSSRAVEILPLRPHRSTESSHPFSCFPLCLPTASRVLDPHSMTRRYTNRFHLLSPACRLLVRYSCGLRVRTRFVYSRCSWCCLCLRGTSSWVSNIVLLVIILTVPCSRHTTP
jgi:hypothetical protein